MAIHLKPLSAEDLNSQSEELLLHIIKGDFPIIGEFTDWECKVSSDCKQVRLWGCYVIDHIPERRGEVVSIQVDVTKYYKLDKMILADERFLFKLGKCERPFQIERLEKELRRIGRNM